MGDLVGLDVRGWIGERVGRWVELVLATPVVLWAALPFFQPVLELAASTARPICGR